MGSNQLFIKLILTLLLSTYMFSFNILFANNLNEKIDPKSFSSKEVHSNETEYSNGSSHKEEFNPGKMIIQHVLDSHEWHILDFKGKHISIPLPIIIYSKERGFFCFSSSRFHHGSSSYEGFSLIAGPNDIQPQLVSKHNEAFYDLSITKTVAAMFFSLFLMLSIFISIARRYAKETNRAPRGIQSFLEPVIVFVRDDIARSSIGENKYERYLPFLLTMFFFILINNFLGLIPLFPGGANVTGNMNIPIVLATYTFVIMLLSSKKHYWSHVINPPGVPLFLKITIMPFVEFIGIISKPIVLMLRLYANITAGHIVILSFITLIFIFGHKFGTGAAFGTSIISMAFTIFIGLLELLVAFLQAYVFTLLSAIYFGMVQEENH